MTAVWIVLGVLVVYALFSLTSYEGEDFDPWPLTAPPDDAESPPNAQ